MKEIFNAKNENIGFSTNKASNLDYFIREQPVSLSGDVFSEVLSNSNAEVRILNRGEQCLKIRFLKGYSEFSTVILREEVCLDSERKRFFVQLESPNEIKGMLLENDRVVKTVGIGGLNPKSVEKFSSEFLSSFSRCKSYAGIEKEA